MATATGTVRFPVQIAFGDVCYSYWVSGRHSQGLNCLKQSKKAAQLLHQELSPESLVKWPQQASLSDLAIQNLLVNPQTKAPIKTPQNFVDAIPATDRDLKALFKDPLFVSALWTYKSPSNVAPTPTPSIPIITPTPPIVKPIASTPIATSCTPSIVKGSNDILGISNVNTTMPPSSASCITPQPASCPSNPQNFLDSDVWPVTGPKLLTVASQTLQNPNGQTSGIYDIYSRLLLQGQCSAATLAQIMKLNGKPVTADQAYQWERDTLITVAIANSSNTQLVTALILVIIQPDNKQVDSWFSGAIITNPINRPAAPTPIATPIPPVTPTTVLYGMLK